MQTSLSKAFYAATFAGFAYCAANIAGQLVMNGSLAGISNVTNGRFMYPAVGFAALTGFSLATAAGSKLLNRNKPQAEAAVPVVTYKDGFDPDGWKKNIGYWGVGMGILVTAIRLAEGPDGGPMAASLYNLVTSFCEGANLAYIVGFTNNLYERRMNRTPAPQI